MPLLVTVPTIEMVSAVCDKVVIIGDYSDRLAAGCDIVAVVCDGVAIVGDRLTVVGGFPSLVTELPSLVAGFPSFLPVCIIGGRMSVVGHL